MASQLGACYLMNVVFYLKTIETAQNFVQVNKKCKETCEMMKINPGYQVVNDIATSDAKLHYSYYKSIQKELELFPNIQTFNFDKQKFVYSNDELLFKSVVPKYVELIRLPKTKVPLQFLFLLDDFTTKITNLYLTIATSRDLDGFDLSKYVRLKHLSLSFEVSKIEELNHQFLNHQQRYSIVKIILESYSNFNSNLISSYQHLYNFLRGFKIDNPIIQNATYIELDYKQLPPEIRSYFTFCSSTIVSEENKGNCRVIDQMQMKIDDDKILEGASKFYYILQSDNISNQKEFFEKSLINSLVVKNHTNVVDLSRIESLENMVLYEEESCIIPTTIKYLSCSKLHTESPQLKSLSLSVFKDNLDSSSLTEFIRSSVTLEHLGIYYYNSMSDCSISICNNRLLDVCIYYGSPSFSCNSITSIKMFYCTILSPLTHLTSLKEMDLSLMKLPNGIKSLQLPTSLQKLKISMTLIPPQLNVTSLSVENVDKIDVHLYTNLLYLEVNTTKLQSIQIPTTLTKLFLCGITCSKFISLAPLKNLVELSISECDLPKLTIPSSIQCVAIRSSNPIFKNCSKIRIDTLILRKVTFKIKLFGEIKHIYLDKQSFSTLKEEIKQHQCCMI